MGTAWALAGGGLVPQPLQPERLGLIHWVRGDAGLTVAATRLSRWKNQHGLNADFTLDGVGDAPYVLGDAIDGVPLVTFGVAGDANKGMRTGAPGGGGGANLVDRFGAPMDGSSARDVFMMLRPDWQAAFARIGGNPLAHSTWGAIFSIWDIATPNTGYAWSHAWQSLDVKWATPDGPTSIYNGVPTLVEWRSAAWPAFEFLVNNVLVATIPADISGWVAGGVGPLFLAGPGNPSFLGGAAESLYYDAKLTATPHAKTVNYMRARFPTAPITPDA